MSIGPNGSFIFNIRSLVVLQVYEVDGSSSGAQENLRSRSVPLIEVQ